MRRLEPFEPECQRIANIRSLRIPAHLRSTDRKSNRGLITALDLAQVLTCSDRLHFTAPPHNIRSRCDRGLNVSAKPMRKPRAESSCADRRSADAHCLHRPWRDIGATLVVMIGIDLVYGPRIQDDLIDRAEADRIVVDGTFMFAVRAQSGRLRLLYGKGAWRRDRRDAVFADRVRATCVRGRERFTSIKAPLCSEPRQRQIGAGVEAGIPNHGVWQPPDDYPSGDRCRLLRKPSKRVGRTVRFPGSRPPPAHSSTPPDRGDPARSSAHP